MSPRKINLPSAMISVALNALLFAGLLNYTVAPALAPETGRNELVIVGLTAEPQSSRTVPVETVSPKRVVFISKEADALGNMLSKIALNKPGAVRPKFVEAEKVIASAQLSTLMVNPVAPGTKTVTFVPKLSADTIPVRVEPVKNKRSGSRISLKSTPRHISFPRFAEAADELAGYQHAVVNKISAAKIYPLSSKKRGEKGVVLLSFLIAKDGQLKDVKLKKSSRYKNLDQAALRTIHRASPFQPLPHSLHKDELWLKLAISYVLED